MLNCAHLILDLLVLNLNHFGLTSVTDLPGVDELKSAGLLQKGQTLGALMDHTDEIGDEAVFPEEGLLDEGLDGDDDASV